jgi:hypothetical protein
MFERATVAGKREVALWDEVPGLWHPWKEVSDRLGRPKPFLAMIDLHLNNAQQRDAGHQFPWSIENTVLRTPMFGTDAERVFYLIIAEMLAVFTPAVQAMVECQDAVLQGDDRGLLRALLVVKQAWDEQIGTFHKISVNPVRALPGVASTASA